jgi:hypothetical protein
MHPYLMELQIKARNEDLRRKLSRPGPAPARHGARPRLAVRHQLGWLLVGLGLRLAVGRAGARRATAARRGDGPVIMHG